MDLILKHQETGAYTGEYQWPVWSALMWETGLVYDSEVVVAFDPRQLGGRHRELEGVRLMALVTYKPAAHVMAVLRGSTREGEVCFRKYDNDGAARQSGTYELVTADELGLTRDCQMQAVVVSV